MVDGRLVIVGAGDDHLVRVWDVERGEVLHRIEGHQGAVHALALLPGADPLVVSGGDDRASRLWHPISGRSAGSYQMPDAVRALAPTPDGRLLAAFGWEVALLRPT